MMLIPSMGKPAIKRKLQRLQFLADFINEIHRNYQMSVARPKLGALGFSTDGGSIWCLLGRKRSRILYLDHVEGDGRLLFEQIVKMDLEGIVCKRKDSPCKVSEKPSRHWIKGQEFPLQPIRRT